MAAEQTRKLDATGLAQVWTLILQNFAKAMDVSALQTQVEALIQAGGEANVIESVSVNGVALQITEKGVNVEVPSGALADLDEVDESHLASALKALINNKAAKATTLSGYGITDAYKKTETYTQSEVDNAISTAVKQALTGVYTVKGSIAFADLPTSGMKSGYMYNIKDKFTTTKAFVEGSGKEYPAGTNVAYTDEGWDVMAGIYDFSEFAKLSDLPEPLSEEEINAICMIE